MRPIAVLALVTALALPARALEVGDSAPDFDVPEADGGRLRLSDHAGKVILLNFWASWCLPCKDEMPQIQEDIHEVYGPDAFTAMGLNSFDDLDVIGIYKHGLLGLELTYPMGEDVAGSVTAAYGVLGLPFNVIIDASGTVQYIELGFTKSAIIAKIEELLATGVESSSWGAVKARYR